MGGAAVRTSTCPRRSAATSW